MRNHIEIHGYLGRDPELKEYRNNRGETKSLCNFSVGVSRDTGDETDWFQITFFGKRAEVIDKFFAKGSQIIVWGRMQCDAFEKDGQKRTAWKIIGEGFDFCDKKDSPRGSANKAAQGEPVQSRFDDIPDSFEAQSDDIPF